MNWQLFSMVWGMTATVVIGVSMIISLVIGFDDIPNIISVAVVGALVAIPVAMMVTKKLNRIS